MKLKPVVYSDLGVKGHLESYCMVTHYLKIHYLHKDFKTTRTVTHYLKVDYLHKDLCTVYECVMMSLCRYPANKVLQWSDTFFFILSLFN